MQSTLTQVLADGVNVGVFVQLHFIRPWKEPTTIQTLSAINTHSDAGDHSSLLDNFCYCIIDHLLFNTYQCRGVCSPQGQYNKAVRARQEYTFTQTQTGPQRRSRSHQAAAYQKSSKESFQCSEIDETSAPLLPQLDLPMQGQDLHWSRGLVFGLQAEPWTERRHSEAYPGKQSAQKGVHHIPTCTTRVGGAGCHGIVRPQYQRQQRHQR